MYDYRISLSGQYYHCALFFEQIFSIKHYCACRDRCSPWPDATSVFPPDSFKTRAQLEATTQEQDGKNKLYFVNVTPWKVISLSKDHTCSNITWHYVWVIGMPRVFVGSLWILPRIFPMISLHAVDCITSRVLEVLWMLLTMSIEILTGFFIIGLSYPWIAYFNKK